MQKYDIHVCLVSDQAAANLLPILDKEFKPASAILFVTQKMKSNAEALQKVFEQKGVKVTQVKLTDEFDFPTLEDEMMSVFEQYENSHIALNATGGTKLMAIAAQNVCAMLGMPIFYVDSFKNRIVFITKDQNNERISDLPLNCEVNIPTYLSAYGMKTKEDKSERANFDLSIISPFIKEYLKYENVIPLLNKYAMDSVNSGYKVKFTDHKINSLIETLEMLKHQGIIDFYDNQIDFKNRDTKDFLNGIWLENYVYSEIKDIKHIQDVRLSLEVGNSQYNLDKNKYDKNNKGNQNEFDIAFMAKNKLHIIECKTQKMDKSSGEKAEEILYKLETLKDYGGLMTKKCLVSYCEVPEAVLNRAKSLHIEVIWGNDLNRLKQKIQNWIAK